MLVDEAGLKLLYLLRQGFCLFELFQLMPPFHNAFAHNDNADSGRDKSFRRRFMRFLDKSNLQQRGSRETSASLRPRLGSGSYVPAHDGCQALKSGGNSNHI